MKHAKDLFSLKGKVAIVTGGRGLYGSSITEGLCEMDATVVIASRNGAKCEEYAAELRARGYDAIGLSLDLSSDESIKSLCKEVYDRYGKIDVLVNNAGIAEQCQIQDIREELWDRIFAVNVKGVLNTVQAVLPDMLHRKSGCIINTSSIWGMHGASCESVYSSSKHAVIGLTKSMAAELALSGIRVNCVAPGVIDTDMVKVLGDETLRDLADNTPIGRLGKPEDIAAAVSYLASDGASFVTGQVLTCDGGFIHL